nr:MAG TPA: hypothetical protein [Caudoviricetes sp.]
MAYQKYFASLKISGFYGLLYLFSKNAFIAVY